MSGNAAVYSSKSELPSVDAIRAMAPGAKVSTPTEKARSTSDLRFALAWPDLKIVVNQMPTGQLPRHLEGFEGYLTSVCEVQDPDLVRRVVGMKQCLGIQLEPDFDEEGRGQAFVLALAGHLEGLCFVHDCVYAPDGQCLAAPPDGDEDGDEDGGDEQDPEDTAHEEETEGDGNTEPPTAQRVARRALVLGAIAARVSLEGDTGADREERRQWLLHRVVKDLALGSELEREERKMLETPAGKLPRKQTLESSWRSEGLVVLAWALGVSELPPHDTLAETWELLIKTLKLLTDEPPPVLQAPKLRTPEELKRLERRLFILHWRVRDFSLKPQAMNFRDFARTAWFGPFDLEGIALAQDDLAVDGRPISQAKKERVWESQSIALERHQAINWLLGRGQVYSRVDTPT